MYVKLIPCHLRVDHKLIRWWHAQECKDLGFDIIELSTGFISIPEQDLLHLIKTVKGAGLKAKPELGIQFGAGGDTSEAELASEGTDCRTCKLTNKAL